MRGEVIDLGFLARAEGRVRGGIVLVHDVWGLYDHFRELAARLADAGFTTLAIDLYRRTPELKVQEPGAFMRELSDPQVLADIALGVKRVVTSSTPAPRVAVIGFCMGGMYALLSGTSLMGKATQVAAVVPFYGILSHEHGLLHSPEGLDPRKKPRSPLLAAHDLACPLLAFYGDRDPYVPLADIAALREALAASGQAFEVNVIEGVGHAFMNETRPQAYAPEAAKAAWARMLDFLARELDRDRT